MSCRLVHEQLEDHLGIGAARSPRSWHKSSLVLKSTEDVLSTNDPSEVHYSAFSS